MSKKLFKVLIYLVLAAILFTSCGTKRNDIAVSPKFAGKIIDMPIKVGDVVS